MTEEEALDRLFDETAKRDPRYPVAVEYYKARWNDDRQAVLSLLRSNPDFAKNPLPPGPLLIDHAIEGDLEIVECLIDLGVPVNEPEHEKGAMTPLWEAIVHNHIDLVRLLLRKGASPNANRMIITAINAEKNALQFVEMLVEHGADLDRTYDFGGPVFTALSWAIANGKQDVVDYLRSKAASMPPEQPKPPPRDISDEVVAYFERNFGPVQPQALIEIVPTGPRITIHVVPPGPDRNHYTLFTTGLSAEAMTVPGDDPSANRFEFAELYIQLPASWPVKDSLSDPNYAWPIHWLRKLAKYPRQANTWLGGPIAVVDNDDPPQPIAPNSKFTSMLLLAERKFDTRDCRSIQLYRLTPLYREERDLEQREGVGVLMRAFDERDVSFVVDSERPNVAVEKQQ